ncbi:MAG: SUMF1/EgtB/PvdO family nonheme iron enzyme [Gammaproteobacteria bacterium]
MSTDNSDQNIPIFTDESSTSSHANEFPERYQQIQFISELDGIKYYRANDERTGDVVSLYTISHDTDDLDNLENLQHQLELVSSLSHSGLVAVTDFEVTDSVYWAETHIEGSTLQDVIRLSITPKKAKQLAQQLIEIITYVNQYTTIGQLSMDDIFINNDGNIQISLNQLFYSLVTSKRKGIIAPEQKSSRNYRSKTADQYILASVISSMLKSVNYHGRKRTDEVLKQATHVEPTKRFKSLSDFEEEFLSAYKVSAAEQWLNPKFITISILLITVVSLGVIYKEPVVTTVSDILPESKEEIAQKNQQATASSTKLLEQLKEYESLFNDYQNDSERSDSAANKRVKRQVLSIMESVLSLEDITIIRSEIKGIETLIREKQFELAITQLDGFSEQVEKAFLTALNAPKVIEKRQRIEQLLSHPANKSIDEQIQQQVLNIDLRIQNRDFKDLYLNELVPLEETLAARISTAASNALSSFFSKIDNTMVRIPSGSFSMGARQAGSIDTRPVHQVSIPSFHVSKFELTNELYNQYLRLSGRGELSTNDDQPVINISWLEVQQMLAWMNRNSSKTYRLLTESEWEYLARANLNTTYPWGNSIGTSKANCKGCGARGEAARIKPVGTYQVNQFGLFDLHGNVWEWTQDCYNRNYDYAPNDGSAVEFNQCKRRVIRGGAWSSSTKELMPFYRSAAMPDFKSDSIGIRLARD